MVFHVRFLRLLVLRLAFTGCHWLTWFASIKRYQPAGLEAVEWREKLTAKSVDASPSGYLLGAEGPGSLHHNRMDFLNTKMVQKLTVGKKHHTCYLSGRSQYRWCLELVELRVNLSL